MTVADGLALAAVIALWVMVTLMAVLTLRATKVLGALREALDVLNERSGPLMDQVEAAARRQDEHISALQQRTSDQLTRLETRTSAALTTMEDTAASHLSRLQELSEEQSRVTARAAEVSENAAQLSQLVNESVGAPLIKTAAFRHGVRTALKGRREA